MASHGSKFASVNLNKSYGQQHQSSHHAHYPHFNGGGGSYGQAAAAGRGRGGGGGSGGGMVVLSRNRGGALKVGSKLSVPPPLNLPSLRKEHEKFDSSAPGGPGAGAGTGGGSRPTSSGVGWTKPVAAAAALPEKHDSGIDTHGVDGINSPDGASRAVGSYMPPSARSNGVAVLGSRSGSREVPPSTEKAMVLRGEDFPSLQAARPLSSGASQKQKDGLNQKQKQSGGEELSHDKKDNYHLGPVADMHSPRLPSRNAVGSRLAENGGEGNGMGTGRMGDQIRKQEGYFPDPLPLVHMKARSDWADDERDTGHRFVEQGRDIGFSRGESYWDRDFDLPRQSVLPHKPAPMADPILTMGRDKRFSKSDRPFSEDPFMRDFNSAGFDEKDIFSGGLVGVIKRKKDAAKSTYFHDPVRQSFEAELDRVQKMQELERHKIIEEQERALEQARREEEDRLRRIREEDERQRRLEEEAREAAWRAEQERLEAVRKAEELRIAREEEKRRMQLEEERRKQAAKQKLEELEAKMAKRQAETANDTSAFKTIVDEKPETTVKEKHILRNLDLDTWEEGERMVENVMTSGPFNSSPHNRHVEMSPRPYPAREGSSNFLDGGKAINSWKRDVFENGRNLPSPLSDQETGHYSPRRDAFGGGRAAPRKEFHGGAGYIPPRPYLRTGMQDPYSDELGYQKDNRWNFPVNADSYGKLREMDSEFHDNMSDRYGEWGQGRARGNTRLPYPERFYPHSEANEVYSYGRSRYPARQPRVLPPPSLNSVQRPNFREVTERAGPSTLLDNGIHYPHEARTESTMQPDYYGGNQGGFEPSEIFGLQQENSTSEDRNLNNKSRCESQSSLSVSSPPNSPPHLSHDELDESGDSPVKSSVAEGKINLLSGSGSVASNGNSGNDTLVIESASVSAVEDEEWTLENDERMQQQEEYDEEEDGYREEDEVREVDDDNLGLNQKFEGLELEETESSRMVDNVVLGFDEGVEVVIPNDDLERNLGTQERAFGIPESSVGIIEEGAPAGGFPSDEQNLLTSEDTHGTRADSSSGTVPEKSALQGSVAQQVGVPYSSAAAGLLDGADSSVSTGLAAQQTVSSAGDVTVATNQTNNNVPSASTGGSQGDLPVKLQFGLFSGPSLIPSPVPAIQIGSIQMPLHIHPPVGPSITHMHPSQPPMFQFGQLHYTSPISQGILPMAPQSMSFVQPNVLGQFNLNQNAGSSGTREPAQDASAQNVSKDEVQSLSAIKQPSFVSCSSEQPNGSNSQGLNTVLDADSHRDNPDNPVAHSSSSGPSAEKMKSESGSQAEKGHHHASSKSYLPSSKTRGSESHSHHVQQPIQYVAGDRSGMRGLGSFSGQRGKRFAYAVKNSNTRPSVQEHDMAADSNGFQRRPRRTVQRTEFRVRENNDRRQAPVWVSSHNTGYDDRPNYNGKAVGVFARSGSKRATISNRTMKQRIEPESSSSGNIISQEANSGDRVAKEMAKDLSIRNKSSSHPGETNLRRNASEEDVDAPLQSGVVRVFKQPGIEAPSDEDDFIEVRSKKQMLHDRREQREKENKAKSRTNKQALRKPRAYRQKDVVSRSHNKISVPFGNVEASSSHLDFTASDSPSFANNESSTGFTTVVSQPPIGTPAINSEAQAVKSLQAGPVSAIPSEGAERDAGLMFDSKNKVMSLSQTQIDEAMKPARYDSHISAVGGHSSTVSDPILPTSSTLTKDKPFSSGASPINSLLAGEKIQFGAVTSPTVLPPSSRVVSHGIGAPGSNRPDVQLSRNFPVSEKDTSMFFEKEKHLNDSCVPLQDCEAEAEAAASAVAVAAISSDEIVGNGLHSVNDTKNFGAADIDGITTGGVGDQNLASQSRGEELSVSLPADLSVETTPISLWPPLPSPQSSSSQMLSHFPTGPPSHFPFYEMNPLLGGPIFAFSPQEESSGTQSQPQKSTSSSSGPLGNWQQCHSGVDSFYGPQGGYPGPFIGPPGGIPGVQGPPHMVVYNHFAPVGQYGQVGLSFMGTTYIPSGKQADWKNNTTSSAMHIGEGDINNVNVNTVQRSAPNMTAPIQHLAPGSPLLPMPSPLPMFDVSPFQTAPDLPVQARWSHIPPSTLHSIPVSRPLQPQGEGTLPSQVNHGHSSDQSLAANRFNNSRTPTPSDNSPNFTVAADTNATSFPPELGLVDALRSKTASSGQSSMPVQSSSGISNSESSKIDRAENGKSQNPSSVKNQFPKKNVSNHHGNSSGYNYQRGGMSQRNHAGNDWPQRRMGFHVRNQSSGVDKGYPAPKVKQIYVAKQTPSGSSTA